MKIVSFDVGLRNLAFCVLSGTTRKDVSIQDWNLIDVMAEEKGLVKPTCFKCNKSACWQEIGGSAYACGKHKGPSGKKAITKASFNKLKVDELWKQFQVKFPGEQKPLKAEMVQRLFDALKTSSWKRAVSNYKAGSVADLAPACAKSLDARMDMWRGADLIVFENQPDRRMFAVQCMLHMFFVARGFRVKGVSAIHKLDNIVTMDDRTDTYKGRKKTGIVHAAELCPTPEWKTYMMKHPKKDDLADSFLQGLWVMEHTK
jgi:hypothetical protein